VCYPIHTTSYYLIKFDLEPDVPAPVKRRAEIYSKYYYDPSDVAKMEISVLQPAIVNTIPTAFWNVAHIASDPSATGAARQELQSILFITFGSGEIAMKKQNLMSRISKASGPFL
jgi:hypothetical protein